MFLSSHGFILRFSQTWQLVDPSDGERFSTHEIPRFMYDQFLPQLYNLSSTCFQNAEIHGFENIVGSILFSFISVFSQSRFEVLSLCDHHASFIIVVYLQKKDLQSYCTYKVRFYLINYSNLIRVDHLYYCSFSLKEAIS